jgi:transposase
MDERMRFVIRLKDGESMASLCREFGISRKTGYKIFERYEQCGLEGLTDRTRRPFRYANQLPEQVEAAIVTAKREKPHWGARKIRERLLRKLIKYDRIISERMAQMAGKGATATPRLDHLSGFWPPFVGFFVR